MNKVKLQYLIYLLFTLSGFIGLIYEATWSRYLKLFLGHSSYGQILTLVIYMGGLGIGSFIGGKYCKNIRNPFYAYTVIELLIGLGGLFYHNIYLFSTKIFYDLILGIEINSFISKIIKVIVSAIITLPEAVLLGMTFPCLAIAVMRLNHDNGKNSLPSLYFFNSIGATIGIIVTSYFLIAKLGTPGTLLFAGTVNILIAGSFYFIGKSTDTLLSIENNNYFEENISGLAKTNNKPENWAIFIWLLISGLTGLSSFIYEIGWIRLLSLLMGSSTHSFDIMVSAFVFGLAFGGLYARRLLNKSKNLLYSIAYIQILMGICATFTIYFYKPFFEIMNGTNLILLRTEESYIIFSIFKYLLALALMFPATFFAGMTLPILTFIVLNTSGNEKYTGYIYGWNTIGAIVGVIFGSLLILPVIQLKFTILSGAIIDIAVGLTIYKIYKVKKIQIISITTIIGLILLPVFFINFDSEILTAGQFRTYFTPNSSIKTKVRDGKTATISFHESEFFREIRTNGKPDAMMSTRKEFIPESDEITMASLAFYPMNIMKEPYDAAIIGMGSGITANYLLGDPLLKKLDIIEIEEEMYNLAKGFLPFNKRVYEDKRVNIIFEDAKTYFYSYNKKYDVIISEPSNPWVSGVSSLFTDEFYTHIKTFLNKDGLLVQWMHRYEFNSELFLTITKAINNNFTNVKIYEPSNKDILIIASQKNFQFDNKRLENSGNVISDLNRLGKNIKYFGDNNYILSTKTLKPVLDNYNPNSDYYPVVDNNSEKAFFLKNNVDLFEPFRNSISYYQEVTEPDTFPEIISQQNLQKKFPEQIIKKIKYLEFLLEHADNMTNWQEIDQMFNELILPYFAYIPVWDLLPSVKFYENNIRKDKVPEKFSQKFLFINSMFNKKTELAESSVGKIIELFSPQELSPNYIRTMLIYCLKNNKPDLYKKIIGKYVINNPNINKYEKILLLSF